MRWCPVNTQRNFDMPHKPDIVGHITRGLRGAMRSLWAETRVASAATGARRVTRRSGSVLPLPRTLPIMRRHMFQSCVLCVGRDGGGIFSPPPPSWTSNDAFNMCGHGACPHNLADEFRGGWGGGWFIMWRRLIFFLPDGKHTPGICLYSTADLLYLATFNAMNILQGVYLFLHVPNQQGTLNRLSACGAQAERLRKFCCCTCGCFLLRLKRGGSLLTQVEGGRRWEGWGGLRWEEGEGAGEMMGD